MMQVAAIGAGGYAGYAAGTRIKNLYTNNMPAKKRTIAAFRPAFWHIRSPEKRQAVTPVAAIPLFPGSDLLVDIRE